MDPRVQRYRIILTTPEAWRWPGYQVVAHDRGKLEAALAHTCGLGVSDCDECSEAGEILTRTRLRYVTVPKTLDVDAEVQRIKRVDPWAADIDVRPLADAPRRRADD